MRPPRLGGNERVGVFATRSNFRPNPIGQSVVKLDRVEILSREIKLHLSGIDLLDGTPVLDIKPYVTYADALVDVEAGMARLPPEKLFNVVFSTLANEQAKEISGLMGNDFCALIEEVLSYDMRPAFYKGRNQKKEFHSQLYGYELKWMLGGENITVTDIKKNII